jgi:predicted RNase H-like HicB family nuclease
VKIEVETETETEIDGRFIAEIPAIPGAMAYGATKRDAVAKVEAMVLRILATSPSTKAGP